MIVANPDAFKSWMTTVLEPLCDADPGALAKYVYALVKKDKPEDDLRRSMMAQLEVFLQRDTEGFVNLLFSKLETEFKCEVAPSQVVRIKEEPKDSADDSQKDLSSHPVEQVSSANQSADLSTQPESFGSGPESSFEETDDFVDKIISNPEETKAHVTDFIKKEDTIPPQIEQGPSGLPSPKLGNGTATTSKSNERRLSSSRSYERKSDSEKEDRSVVTRRRGSSGSPERRRFERSRSRSWERRSTTRRSRSRSRRSRSRGRDRDRSRAWRNKSPPFRGRFERDRMMRSSWSKSPVMRSRSRSPIKSRSRYRHRSLVTRSRSRSHSFDSPRRSPFSRGTTPTLDGDHHGEDLRQTINQNIANKELTGKKRRCRDYDEKGYCMRGEMCPYDHGSDPMVVEDVGQVLQTIHPPPSIPIVPAITPGPSVHISPPFMNRPPPNLSEYNPDAPSMEPRTWSKQPFRGSGRGMGRLVPVLRGVPPFPPHAHNQRELINVTVTEREEGHYYASNAMKRQCPPDFGNEMEPVVKQRFDYNRLGTRARGGNCSLHLRKIPSGLNNIAHLHNHFFKFGKIVNIQVSFEGDPEAALITFTTHAEASAALKSTEAVLNNRFIKVYWYNPDKDNKQENIVPQLTRTSAKERLGAPIVNVTAAPTVQQAKECEKVLMSGSNITKTVYIPPNYEVNSGAKKPEQKKMLVTANFPPNPLEVQAAAARELMKKKVEKRKEALSLTKSYLKKKSDMIEEALNHQRVLIERLENPNTPPERKPEIVEALKALQEETQALKDSIPTIVNQTDNTVKVSPQMVKRTREEMQKQILDAELDLFNQQQEGKDTTELQKRMLELRTKAQNLGMLINNGGVLRLNNRGGGRFRPTRGNSNFNPHVTVDHRPTKLLVSGFESDDKADVLQHFSKFGEVVGHVWDEATPALVIQFKTRKEAESAMSKGRNFQDRLMSVTWFNQAQNMGMRNAGMRSVILLNENVGDLISEHEDEDEALRINIDATEDFLLQDEEEEEDEERSWRR